MSHFGQKLGTDFQTFGRKLSSNQPFGNKNHLHTINHGINKFAEYALPAIGIATMAQPELAPIGAGLATGIKVIQGASNLVAKFADEFRGREKPHNPQLQR